VEFNSYEVIIEACKNREHRFCDRQTAALYFL
jgi:hypothetical protein